jgi:hypothetical protein
MASDEDDVVDKHVHGRCPELTILHDEPRYCTILIPEPFGCAHPVFLFDLIREENLQNQEPEGSPN